ncbi:DUF6012 family protein [Paracidovorax wautersii]|uniref:Uncharacterized protein n=1 Tax=Paracidovorax wautersii TaxID=1177982 RepID=A0A1I2I0C2_9BURK|nr:DUF6012 family protein [Paracidovorax wautersii]SFF34477.1 hypothetical protein SAMN04489711_1442 [Paracidovorax wautersii]
MLIHLTPRLYVTYVPARNCSLIDLTCPELGLQLQGGVDLSTGTPWRNTHYLVAMKKGGRRAIDGFFVEAPRHVPEFTTTARWLVDGQTIEHVVVHKVLDETYDAVTQCMLLWGPQGSFDRRWPEALTDWSIMACQPTMEFFPSTHRRGDFKDSYAQGSGEQLRLQRRVEAFPMHTVERARLLPDGSSIHDRLPALADAFQATLPC